MSGNLSNAILHPHFSCHNPYLIAFRVEDSEITATDARLLPSRLSSQPHRSPGMSQPRRRVSYIIPPTSNRIPRLRLPPHGRQRLGAVGPLLVPFETQETTPVESTPPWSRHPRHRLGISSLALDTSTQLVGSNAPGGILYSGGRDGLIMAWDLGIPMKRRKARTLPTGLKGSDH